MRAGRGPSSRVAGPCALVDAEHESLVRSEFLPEFDNRTFRFRPRRQHAGEGRADQQLRIRPCRRQYAGLWSADRVQWSSTARGRGLRVPDAAAGETRSPTWISPALRI